MESETTPTSDSLHKQMDEFFKQAMEWKRRALNAERNYNYWRNRAERAEERLGIVPAIPDDDLEPPAA